MKLPEVEPIKASHGDAWHALLSLLSPGPELERLARTTGALLRKRGVREAPDLLRVALSYGFCGLSFTGAAAWAHSNGSGKLSKSAVLRRFQKCGSWLEGLLASQLSAPLPDELVAGMRIRLVDATRVSAPGDKGRSWRIHAVYAPWERRLQQLQITDHKGGERLDRFAVQSGDLIVGDRAYGGRRGVAHVVDGGGHFLVRSTWNHLPLESLDGKPFDLFEAFRGLPEEGPADFECRTVPDARNGIPSVRCRVVATRKTAEAAEAAQKKILAEAKKKGYQVDPRTLEACHYFFVVTSVPAQTLTPEQVLTIYRLRWQIEIEFKRLKSLLNLDDLRSKQPATVRAALAAKLLGAVCIEQLAAQFPDTQDHWTLTGLLKESLRQAILGQQAATRWLQNTAESTTRLRGDSRRRIPQCNAARALLA